MAEVARIPAVIASPTTFAYIKHAKRNKPFYTPGFKLTKEQWQLTLLQPWLRKTDPLMPIYPYPANTHFPEANYGLYGGGTIQSGNKISKGRNKGKTIRHWFPNVRLEKIKSSALGTHLHIPIRARVMRTIEKSGGLDEYLIGDKPARIKELGLLGWKLRYLVMQTPKMQQRFAEERARLGLPTEDPLKETFADVWNNPGKRKELIAHQDEAWKKMRAQLDGQMEGLNKQWGRKEIEMADIKPGVKNLGSFIKESKYTANTLHVALPSTLALPQAVEEVTRSGDKLGRPKDVVVPESQKPNRKPLQRRSTSGLSNVVLEGARKLAIE